jgi:tetratricopeptide (TPR) repeat protein
MSGKPRGHQKDLTQLRQELRAQGWTYVQIAGHIREIEHVNSRVAFRLTHGMTQQAVADRWNELFPSEDGTSMMTAKQISYWETWPQSGRKPGIEALNRLARIYCCQAADLLDGKDYRHLDEATRQEIARPTVDTVLDPTGSPILPGLSLFPALSEGSGGNRSGLDMTRAPEANSLLSQVDLPNELAAALLRQLGTLVSTASEGGSSARQRDVAFAQLVHLLTAWATNMDRREVLRILGWAATAAAAPVFHGADPDDQARLALALDSSHRIDGRIIEHIEAVLWRSQRQDDALGPQAALDTVLAQRNLARALLPECPPQLRPRLLSALSVASRHAGWLSFDLNDFDSAWYYYEDARSLAHEAENTELGAFVLCNMSHLATWQGKPRIGIDHAVAAGEWAKRTDDMRLRAYAADVAARAYAAENQPARSLAALDNAADALAAAGDQPPGFAYFYDEGMHVSSRGLCYLKLHQPEQAADYTRQSLTTLDDSFVRNRAMNMLYLGIAQVQLEEVDEAAQLIGDAGQLAVRNSSARLVELLRTGRASVEPWRQTAPVRRLDDRLASYSLGVSGKT